MLDDFSVLYGEINGMLYALERVNSKTNTTYTFSLDFCAKDAKKITREVIQDYFKSTVNYSKLELEELPDWKAMLTRELTYWLLDYLNTNSPTGSYLADIYKQYTFSLDYGKNSFITELLQKITNLILPGTVWLVKLVPIGYYDHGVDFALESANRIFFLHLGVSD